MAFTTELWICEVYFQNHLVYQSVDNKTAENYLLLYLSFIVIHLSVILKYILMTAACNNNDENLLCQSCQISSLAETIVYEVHVKLQCVFRYVLFYELTALSVIK
jgi:hypothetical protein